MSSLFRKLSLPAHWHLRTDEHGREFYWNSHTFKTQFTRPEPLPSGWREQLDHETGEVYIYNIWTRETRPAPTERQTIMPPPPQPTPPPPSVEEYQESVRSRRATMSPISPGGRQTAAGLAQDETSVKIPELHTPRTAAKLGVPVTVDPFSLSTGASHKSKAAPAGSSRRPRSCHRHVCELSSP